LHKIELRWVDNTEEKLGCENERLRELVKVVSSKAILTSTGHASQLAVNH
jgi:hypothetical protein